MVKEKETKGTSTECCADFFSWFKCCGGAMRAEPNTEEPGGGPEGK